MEHRDIGLYEQATHQHTPPHAGSITLVFPAFRINGCGAPQPIKAKRGRSTPDGEADDWVSRTGSGERRDLYARPISRA